MLRNSVTLEAGAIKPKIPLSRNVTKEEVNEAFKKTTEGELKGILAYTEEPVVSVDLNHNPHSVIVDGLSTMVVRGNLVKVLAWYDIEMGILLPAGGGS